jgi:hypothetical protein
MLAAFQKRWHIETLRFQSPKKPNKIRNHLRIVAPLDYIGLGEQQDPIVMS